MRHVHLWLLALPIAVVGCTAADASPSPARSDRPAPATSSATPSLAPSVGASSTLDLGESAAGDMPDPDELADELITPDTLVACHEFPVPRFAELDGSGEPTGASVDLSDEIGRRIGLSVEHRDAVFEEIIPDIEAGDCDLGLAGHIITPEREERITMVPYLRGRQELIVRAGNPEGLVSLTDLCGRTVLTRDGSLQEQLVLGTGPYVGEGLNDQCAAADEPELDLATFPGELEAVEAFIDGEGDAFLGSNVWTVEYPDDLEESQTVVLPGYTNGIGINLDDRLLADAVRAALDAMIDDGTYLEILTEWGVGQPL